MAVLVNRSYLQASSANLATDLARYGSAAVWRGVYYRGEKIGFTVSQTRPDRRRVRARRRTAGCRCRCSARRPPATIRTTAHVDKSFALRSFEFSLDPGHRARSRSAASVDGTPPRRSTSRRPAARGREDARARGAAGAVAEPLAPPRRTAAWCRARSTSGRSSIPPRCATRRSTSRSAGASSCAAPARRRFRRSASRWSSPGLHTTSWVTDTGEVVREESPLGLITVRESPDSARAMAVSRPDAGRPAGGRGRRARACGRAIDEPRDVRRLRMRLDGADLSAADLRRRRPDASTGNVVELRDPQAPAGRSPPIPTLARYLAPEPFIESDAPEIRAEAETRRARRHRRRARAPSG